MSHEFVRSPKCILPWMQTILRRHASRFTPTSHIPYKHFRTKPDNNSTTDERQSTAMVVVYPSIGNVRNLCALSKAMKRPDEFVLKVLEGAITPAVAQAIQPLRKNGTRSTMM